MALVFCCTLPVSSWFFSETSLLSPLTNVFLMPFCSLILICTVLTVLTGGVLATFFCRKAMVCCEWVTKAVLWLEKYLPLRFSNSGKTFPMLLLGAVAGRLFDLVLSATEKAAVRSALRTACRSDCGTSWHARTPAKHAVSLCAWQACRGGCDCPVREHGGCVRPHRTRKKSAVCTDLLAKAWHFARGNAVPAPECATDGSGL